MIMMSRDVISEVTVIFKDTESRNEWISQHFPERKTTDVPGLFSVKKGLLKVFLNKVTFEERR